MESAKEAELMSNDTPRMRAFMGISWFRFIEDARDYESDHVILSFSGASLMCLNRSTLKNQGRVCENLIGGATPAKWQINLANLEKMEPVKKR